MNKRDLKVEDTEVYKVVAVWVPPVYLGMFCKIIVKHEIKYGLRHLIKLF